MNAPQRTLSRCLVCGFSEIRTDEVIDRGVVLLAECQRCRHRWTHQAVERPAKPLRAARTPAEDAHAA
jgi:hypothetical protein